MWVASRMPNSVPLSVTVSPTRRARTSRSPIGMAKSWWAISSSDLDALGREQGGRAPGRMALDVDRDRVHGDVGRGQFDVDRERGRIAAQPLRADAEGVDRRREQGFELGAFGVGTARAE